MEVLSVSIERKDKTYDVDFADERITNSVDKGKRVKDCCNLVSSTTAEASWKTRKRWIQNISMESLSYSNRQI